MKVQEFAERYSKIELDPRNARRHNALFEQLMADYPDITRLSLAELSVMLDQWQEQQVKIRMPLFAQVIYPILSREIEAGNPAAIKIMLLRFRYELGNYGRMREYTKDADIYRYDELVDRYLDYDPEDRQVLTIKANRLDDYLYYTVHEAPLGVIGIKTPDDCRQMLQLLDEFRQLCLKLQIDRERFIRFCAMHYRGYSDYLQHQADYASYATYIEQHADAFPDQPTIGKNYYYTK